jgi:hypothetical protein
MTTLAEKFRKEATEIFNIRESARLDAEKRDLDEK